MVKITYSLYGDIFELGHPTQTQYVDALASMLRRAFPGAEVDIDVDLNYRSHHGATVEGLPTEKAEALAEQIEEMESDLWQQMAYGVIAPDSAAQKD